MKKKIIYNEKRKKFLVQNLKWATAHLSRRLGSGLGSRHSDTARRCAGGARGTQAQRRRHGRAGAGRAGTGALGAQGEWARGRRTLGRGAAAARRARGARRVLVAGARAGTVWARRGARLGARCTRGTADLSLAWALDGCAGWASWASFGALCT